MNRLTDDDNFCEDCGRRGDCVFAPGLCQSAKRYNRLRKYELTGLEPEEAEACKVALMGKTLAEIKEIEGLPVKRMTELAKAEAEGRLIVLPCGFGADIYTIVTTDRSRGARACPRPVKWVRFGQLTWNNLRSVLSEFGKTVFLTREEAEAALKEGAG